MGHIKMIERLVATPSDYFVIIPIKRIWTLTFKKIVKISRSILDFIFIKNISEFTGIVRYVRLIFQYTFKAF